MKQFVNVLLCTAALLGFSSIAQAQYGSPGGPYQPDSVDALVDQVHTDLNHGYDHWRLSNADRDRLTNAEKQLRAFARDWRHEKFDKGELDNSIAAIQHVLDNNDLRGSERDALSSDVDRLRNMREAYDRHEIGRW
jgi:peptidoglycan/xylan/chitin deacetylase (PgdA/CDA1 family)